MSSPKLATPLGFTRIMLDSITALGLADGDPRGIPDGTRVVQIYIPADAPDVLYRRLEAPTLDGGTRIKSGGITFFEGALEKIKFLAVEDETALYIEFFG